VLLAGIAAGLVSWIAGEETYNLFRPRLFRVEILGGMVSMQPSPDSQKAADLQNGALAFAILGGVTGLAMGLAGGHVARSVSRAFLVGLGAQALGTAVGAITSWYVLPLLYQQRVPDPNDLLTPILVHGAIWGAIGAVGGLALSLGMGHESHPIVATGAGCLGAILAAVLYQVLSGTLFPDARITDLVAVAPLDRLLTMLLVPVSVAIAATRGALGRLVATPFAAGYSSAI
jgi:hypothetical protein